MSPFRRNGLKWTEWTRPCSISLRSGAGSILNKSNYTDDDDDDELFIC